MNGWELADAVRRRWPSVRFLLATGWGAAIDPGEARARGVEAVLGQAVSPRRPARGTASERRFDHACGVRQHRSEHDAFMLSQEYWYARTALLGTVNSRDFPDPAP